MSSSSPLVVGDLVYVVTGNGVDTEKTHVPAPRAPSFVTLNRNTGKLVWSDASPGKDVLHGQWSSPAYGVIGGVPQVIYGGGDGWLRGFEPTTGRPLWQFDGNRKAARLGTGSATRLNYFVATPVVVDGRIYVGTGQNPEFTDGAGDLWCLAPAGKTGDVSAELVDRDSHFFPVIRSNPNSAVAWHRGGPNPDAKGLAPWLFGRTISTVAVRDRLVYASELSGLLYCLDAATGELCWLHDLKEVIWGSPLWVDDKVILPTYGEDVFVFRHGREKKLLDRTRFDAAVATAPVVANGVLYIATERHLYSIEGK
jgi:outer membrane protein assembly factor BamB